MSKPKGGWVIVVGAGMAGLAAADALRRAGLEVRVLEARQRIGGRSWSDHSLGISVDLGGAWMHGTVGNPLMPLVEQFKVRYALTDFYNRLGGKVAIFDAAGAVAATAAAVPVEPRLLNEGRQRLARIFERAKQRQGGDVAIPRGMGASGDVATSGDVGVDDVSLDVIIQEGRREEREREEREKDEKSEREEGFSDLQQRLFNYVAYTGLQLYEAADTNTLSWRLKDEFIELDGGDQLMLDGYNSLTDRLAAGLDIRTGVVVRQVEYGAEGVRLMTDRGEERARLAVITVPLGVLKAGSISFAPALPAEKQGAIERIGMGLFEKLALKFPRRFWPNERQIFLYMNRQHGYFSTWLNLAHYHETPVLVASHGGSAAFALNRLDDAALVEAAMVALRGMFGPDVVEPEAYIRTRWQDDPFTLGSYSFNKVGGRPGDRLALARPVANRLFFAGEATQPQFYATVHGAYDSGRRAAGEILNDE